MVRLISITFSLGVIAVIGLLGYRVMNPLAGLLSAGIWTITPLIVEYSRYATADNFVTFFVLLALFLALSATRYDRDDWARWGLVCGLLAIVFKYQAIFVLTLILVLPLWRLIDPQADRRRILRHFGGTLIILFLFMVWLIVLYPTLEATSSPDWSAPNERLTFPTISIILTNLRVTYSALAKEQVWLIGLAGLVELLIRRFRQQVYMLGFISLILAALMWLTGLSFYGNLGSQQFRQLIAASAFLTIVRACGLAGWALLITAGLEYVRQLSPSIRAQRTRLGAVIVVVLVFIGMLTQINTSIANARKHTLPDRRNDLATWMDTTLPPAPIIANLENEKTLNRSWGGYAGKNEFTLVETAALQERSIQAWREMGVMYVITSDNDYRTMLNNPNDADYVSQTLLLKAYPPSNVYRGPNIAVLRLFPIQHPADGIIGSVHLVGYDLDHATVKPGDSFTFALYWKADTPLDGDYTVYNHLTPPDSRAIIAQVDGIPMPDERRPTTSWNDPNETLMSRPFTLQIPSDTPPGEYRLISGFYRADNGTRLLTTSGDDYLLVTTITVAN